MMNEVPCGDCFLCCTKGGIKLKPEDYAESGKPRFIVMPNLLGDSHELGHREGMCVYLHEGQCAIHNDKPVVCKEFDCRKLSVMFSKVQINELVAEGFNGVDYWERGKELILGEQHG